MKNKLSIAIVLGSLALAGCAPNTPYDDCLEMGVGKIDASIEKAVDDGILTRDSADELLKSSYYVAEEYCYEKYREYDGQIDTTDESSFAVDDAKSEGNDKVKEK